MAGSPKKRQRRVEQGLAVAPASTAASRHVVGCGCARCVGAGPGNALATTHGSYETLATDNPRVMELADMVEATQPVGHPADRVAIERYAMVLVRLERSQAALDEADEHITRPGAHYLDSTTWLSRLRDDHRAWHREAMRLEEALARTPASRAKLGLHLATAQRVLGESLLERYADKEEGS